MASYLGRSEGGNGGSSKGKNSKLHGVVCLKVFTDQIMVCTKGTPPCLIEKDTVPVPLTGRIARHRNFKVLTTREKGRGDRLKNMCVGIVSHTYIFIQPAIIRDPSSGFCAHLLC